MWGVGGVVVVLSMIAVSFFQEYGFSLRFLKGLGLLAGIGCVSIIIVLPVGAVLHRRIFGPPPT
jgi:hypothetical protein